MNDDLWITKQPTGFVKLAPCRCCLHVRFQRLFWRFKQSDFLIFCKYIRDLASPEGFASNELEPGLALLALEHERQAVLLSLPEIQELLDLLEAAQIAQARTLLQQQFQLGSRP